MEDYCEISLKNICCTCLSTERNLSQLCRIDDGVKNLFFLLSKLSYKSEAFEDVTQLFICWECTAIMKRIVRFRAQACIAQTKLTDIADGKIPYSKIECLSKLMYYHENDNCEQCVYDIKVEPPENFVDCGPDIVKVEQQTDADDVPLACLCDFKKERDTKALTINRLDKNNISPIDYEEINDDYDDNDTSDADTVEIIIKKPKSNKTEVKNTKKLAKCENNDFSSSANMLDYEKPDSCNMRKSKNIKRKAKRSLDEINDNYSETDHGSTDDSEIGKSNSKRKVKKRNVNIPISNGEENNDNFIALNKLDRLVKGMSHSFIIKSQSKKDQVKNNSRHDTSTNLSRSKMIECYNIIQMTDREVVKSIQARKLEDSYVSTLNKCEDCIEIFENCDSLEKHISEAHTQKPSHTQCNICKVYVQRGSMISHRKVHYVKYQCRLCKEMLQYEVNSTSNLANHLKTKHYMQNAFIDKHLEKLNSSQGSDRSPPRRGRPRAVRHNSPAASQPCGELSGVQVSSRFPSPLKRGPAQEGQSLEKLEVMIDDPKGASPQRTAKGFACQKCRKYFKNKNLRNKHVQKYHRERLMRCRERHQCPTCGKKFAFRKTLERHELTHSSPPPREPCPACGKMVRVDLARAHARIHASRKQYMCVACDKTFISRQCYEKHLKYTRAHAADRAEFKYKCEVCGKDYRLPGELRDHYNYAHMGRTHHKCPICDKALATARGVIRHIQRTHQAAQETQRNKLCQTCGRAFKCRQRLREHEMRHTGERPLSCDMCARTFRQKASLYTHRRRVHKVALKTKPVHQADGATVMNTK